MFFCAIGKIGEFSSNFLRVLHYIIYMNVTELSLLTDAKAMHLTP